MRALVLALACVALPSLAADKATDARIEQLLQRIDALEKKVAELSKPAAAPAQNGNGHGWGAAPAAVAPVDAEEEEHGGDEGGGLKVEGSVLAVLQGANGGATSDGDRQTRANYRGDIVFTLPLATLGEASTTAVGQLRFGQGTGLALGSTYTGAVNSTAFESAGGSDETYAIVAQAYLQFDWALDGGRFNDLPGDRAEFTVGKLDLFGFFDQNAVAGDEGAQFLNNVFVHNPLLDSGGDIAADAYGFAPGLRAAYFKAGDDWSWGASVGVFGAGGGSTFGSGGSKPLVIAQVEASPMQINGEPRGNYRLYAWTNGRTAGLDEQEERHTGFGLSVDQRLGAAWNLFGRYGRRTSGSGSFDDALTLGFEHGGRSWGRAGDTVGLAVGWLKTSDAWERSSGSNGSEQLAELYYRIKLNEHLELTPDFQLIRRPGGVDGASTMKVIGARAAVGF